MRRPLTFAREVILTDHYKSTLELAYDFAGIINAELKALVDEGADFIQIDEPSYVHVETEPREMVDLFNAAVQGVDAKLALHICFGTYAGRTRMARRTYRQLFPTILEARADQFVLEFANRQLSEVELWREFDVDRELGAGVVDIRAFAVERPEDVADRIQTLRRHVPAEKLWVNPDCGFSSTARWICAAKLEAMVQGTRLVRQELAG